MARCHHEGCFARAPYALSRESKDKYCREHKTDGMIRIEKRFCSQVGCMTSGSFAVSCDAKERYCKIHKQEGMFRIADKLCKHDGCKTVPIYNVPGEKRGLWCLEHKTVDMIDVVNRRCSHPGCSIRPNYNVPGASGAIMCAEHRTCGMIEVKKRHCEHPNCDRKPSFAIPGAKKASFCSEHRSDNMINIKRKRCAHEGCDITPGYNIRGSRSARYCSSHRTADMVCVIGKQCEYPGCEVAPNYNVLGSTEARFCAQHRTAEMIDVRNKKCQREGCPKQPTFNTPGLKPAFCMVHKLDGMVNVKNNKCISPGCTTAPNYNIVGSTKPLYCVIHKTEEMIDVVAGRCSHQGCSAYAHYGPLFGRSVHCASHHTPNEFVRRYPKCTVGGCKERPTHVIDPPDIPSGCGPSTSAAAVTTKAKSNYPTHCAEHAQQSPNSRAVLDAMCKQCKLEAIVSAVSGLCSLCEFGTTHKTYHKVKEERMANAIALHTVLSSMLTSHDTVLPDSLSCNSKRRPDFVFDRHTYCVILEVDECMHSRNYVRPRHESNSTMDAQLIVDYACDCELVRMIQIHQTVGLPTVFIRYNPDGYTDNAGKRHPKSNNSARDIRALNTIASIMRDIDAANGIVDGLYVAYLYYDGARADTSRDTAYAERYKIDYINNLLSAW